MVQNLQQLSHGIMASTAHGRRWIKQQLSANDGSKPDFGGTCMVSAEREPITRSGGRAPSGVQGQSPWSGVRGQSEVAEAERLFALSQPEESANLSRNLFLQYKNVVGRLGSACSLSVSLL